MDSRKSGLFLMELLIVITVFAVCAAICVSIFTEAYLTAAHTRDVSRAVNEARSAAEAFKATGRIPGAVYYNSDWQPCQEDGASFVVWLEPDGGSGLIPTCTVRVQQVTGETLVSLTAASRFGGGNG